MNPHTEGPEPWTPAANKRAAKRLLWLLSAGSLISIGILWRAKENHKAADNETRPDRTNSSVTATSQAISASSPATEATSPKQTGLDLTRLTEELRRAGSSTDTKTVLLRLRALLRSLPPSAASEAIQDFLSKGTDARTRQGFVIGAGGQLLEAPTLRTFLLNELESIDPAAAASAGRGLLSRLESPDEWALALRSVARFDTSAPTRSFLEERMHALLSHVPWQQQPQTSYLEAFDVAVHLGGESLLPDLTRLIRMTNNAAVSHAAFLAMDRMIQSDAAPMLKALLSDPEAMRDRESTRASFFARADLTNLEQRRLIESYLLHPAVTPSELEAFADVFPNENTMLSQNLLTQVRTHSGAEIHARDLRTLKIIQAWRQEPRFQHLQPLLQSIQNRLESFMPDAAARSPRRSGREAQAGTRP